MQGDPFLKLIEIIKREGKESVVPFFIGKVISGYPKEIVIKIDTIQIDKHDFMISSGIANTLNAGDSVLVLMSQDMQQFVIVSKVVTI
jgi:hypothetical protein